MISKEDTQQLTKLKVYERTEPSYIKNLIIQSAMDGKTNIRIESLFFQDGEVNELEQLGYEIYRTERDFYNISWD